MFLKKKIEILQWQNKKLSESLVSLKETASIISVSLRKQNYQIKNKILIISSRKRLVANIFDKVQIL